MPMLTKQQTAQLFDAILTKRPVENDCPLLDDATLRAALNGKASLSDEQKKALLSSPITLRRFKRLSYEKHATHVAAQSSATESNVVWLRAADTDDHDFDLRGDGFSIYFSRGPDQRDYVRLVIDPDLLPEDCRRVVLSDSTGQELLSGVVDRNDEINGIWPLDTPPIRFLHNRGLKLRWFLD